MLDSYFDTPKEQYYFNDLPIGAKKAIAVSFWIEPFINGSESSIQHILEANMPQGALYEEYEDYTDEQWDNIFNAINSVWSDKKITYFEAPTEIVAKQLIEFADFYEDHTFEELTQGKADRKPKYRNNERWACIANDNSNDEIFHDGWNRLDYYLNQGDKTIPIIELW